MRQLWGRLAAWRPYLAALAVAIYVWLAGDARDEKIEAAARQANRVALQNAHLVAQIIAEGRERRHQICLRDEREHKDAVKGLRRTYEYLLAAEDNPREREGLLYQFVLRALPEAEREARVDQAPKFCDEGTKASPVGLPEPDPTVPERPEALR